MSQRSSVSPPLPTTTFFSTLTPDAPDAPEACANAIPVSEDPSAAAPPAPRRLLRSIDGWSGIGGLYTRLFRSGGAALRSARELDMLMTRIFRRGGADGKQARVADCGCRSGGHPVSSRFGPG